jgi:arginine decarboxylase
MSYEATLEARRKKKKTNVSLNWYRSIWEIRADSWIQLNDDLGRLVQLDPSVAEYRRRHARAGEILNRLKPIESYWAFPGRHLFDHLLALFEANDIPRFHNAVRRINRALAEHTYRHQQIDVTDETEPNWEVKHTVEHLAQIKQPYFEVLIVDEVTQSEEAALRRRICDMRRPDDHFIYDIVVVPSFEDALIGTLFNFNLQACIIRHGFPFKSEYSLDLLRGFLEGIEEEGIEGLLESERGPLLGQKIAELRPELDLYLVTNLSAEEVAAKSGCVFRRLFFREEDDTELYMAVPRGVEERYATPFFTALKAYSKQPTGVFHALPVSRGKSILQSNWIQDMAQFYGLGIFLAETSATSGGLDSLLDPVGPIKLAQEHAARAFGAKRTFFVTNGTSTANKIVVQALIKPEDIVIVDRNCHKSHHYGMVLMGAHVCYLDSYPLSDYSMYGAVPLSTLKSALLDFKKAGKLDRVKMILLTNCTFDGVVYDVERVMEELLAIKTDLIFLWDEAWFAFARFHPTYRRRTAMAAAARLREKFRSAAYRASYAKFAERFTDTDQDDYKKVLSTRLIADPERARVRVYATQSTHKTLTALRQGSMIHIYDQDFKDKAEEAFHEAYMTHTSTSPNYQILASLDVGRRQVELEGYELVQRQIDLAMELRERVKTHPLIQKYFRFLTMNDIIPKEYRPSGVESYYSLDKGWSRMEEAWRTDEFVLDPTRLTLSIGASGIDGDTFKNEYLMDKYGIQINKTSRNTVLFMTNIGTTRSSIAYLIEILVRIAQDIQDHSEDMSPMERRIHEVRVASLTTDLPPLPDFSEFHRAFRHYGAIDTPEGNVRRAFFLAYDEAECEYFTLNQLHARVHSGHEIVSSMFVIPYPPGFPILVPGQVISEEIVKFMQALDVKEIHGYRPELGLRVFTKRALEKMAQRMTAEQQPAVAIAAPMQQTQVAS